MLERLPGEGEHLGEVAGPRTLGSIALLGLLVLFSMIFWAVKKRREGNLLSVQEG